MKLQSIFISRTYGTETEYTGQIAFDGDNGEIKLPLDQQLSTEVLKLCASSLVRASKDLANKLTESVISQATLPAPTQLHSLVPKTPDDDIPF